MSTCWFCSKTGFCIPCQNCFPEVCDYYEEYDNGDNHVIFSRKYLFDKVDGYFCVDKECGVAHYKNMDEAKKIINELLGKGYLLNKKKSNKAKSGIYIYTGLIWLLFGYFISGFFSKKLLI